MVELIIETTVFAIVVGAFGAILDRARGTTDGGEQHIWRLLYAFVLAAVSSRVTDTWWASAIFMAVAFLGSMPGWGKVLGDAMGGAHPDKLPASWQVGFLKDSRIGLVARGAMWLAPVLVLGIILGYWHYVWAWAAMTIAFVASPYASRYIVPIPKAGERYAPTEYVRGFLAVGLAALSSSVI